MRVGSRGEPAAVVLAAVGTAWLARALPVRFEYEPNALGIVSWATQHRYPAQQELFWWSFALAAGSALAWLLGRVLRRGSLDPAPLAALEAGAAGSLLALLWLPARWAAPLGLALAALALWLGRRSAVRSPEPPAPPPPAPEPSRTRLRAGLAALGLVGLALLLTPGVWVNGFAFAGGVPDAELVRDDFKFLGETGQHLAWADALRRGDFQGRDVFCLYGPLYDLGLAGFWELTGRSIAGWHLYRSLTRALGWLAALGLGAALVRRRPLVLLLPLLLPWVELRMGLALAVLLLLSHWLRGGAKGWCAAAGVAAGASLLFSQEFGLASLVAVAVVLAVRRDGGAALHFGAGALAVIAPLFAWYAAHDALVPMLRDLVSYPRYVMAGYAKLPFPALLPELPLHPASFGESRVARLGHAVPAVCLAGALLALPVSAFDPRRPLASLREMAGALARDPARLTLLATAVLGGLAFRSALGRSDGQHIRAVLPPAALLLCAALDRAVAPWRALVPWRRLAAWRVAALALLALHAGFLESGRAIGNARASLESVARSTGRAPGRAGSAPVMEVVHWVRSHTRPAEPVLFLPNDAAYYYLTERPSPIRFVMGHQIATRAQRDEVLSGLRRDPPRFVVWDDGALRVDGLSDEEVFGRELLEWIEASYAEEVRIGRVAVLRRRGSS